MAHQSVLKSSLVCIATALLVACGGGGGGGGVGGTASNPVNVVTVGTSSAPYVAAARTLVPTLTPGATAPILTSAVCPTFSGGVANPVISTDADVQAINSILGNADLASYEIFVRAPEVLAYWTRQFGNQLANTNGKFVSFVTLGAGVHESIHDIDSLLTYGCNNDGFRRYFVNGAVQVSGMKSGDTLPYGIVSETYPPSLISGRWLRYTKYITGIGVTSGTQFTALLDELNAYVTGAQFEYRMVKNADYSYLIDSRYIYDANAGGMTDFMLYLQSYLKAARLNHTASYTAIINQPATKAVMQTLWTAAEAQLVNIYPYSVKAGGQMIVPTDVLAQVYSAPFLQELDMVGITHKSAADFAAAYLKP